MLFNLTSGRCQSMCISLSFIFAVQGKYCTRICYGFVSFQQIIMKNTLIPKHESKSWPQLNLGTQFVFFLSFFFVEKNQTKQEDGGEEKWNKTSANWFSLYFIFIHWRGKSLCHSHKNQSIKQLMWNSNVKV